MPKSSPKGKANKEEEAVPPYTPQKMKFSTQCFIDADIMETRGLSIFKGEFFMPKKKRSRWWNFNKSL